MTDHEHGEHVPGRGWYDRGLRGFVDSPGKVTATLHPRPSQRSLHAQQWNTGVARTSDIVTSSQARTFRPSTQMETLRRLRDSDRPEDRQSFEQMARGTTRISLGDYENGLRAHLAAGGDLPDGVTAPKEG